MVKRKNQQRGSAQNKKQNPPAGAGDVKEKQNSPNTDTKMNNQGGAVNPGEGDHKKKEKKPGQGQEDDQREDPPELTDQDDHNTSALVLTKDTTIRGVNHKAGEVLFVGQCTQGFNIEDISRIMQRGHIKTYHGPLTAI